MAYPMKMSPCFKDYLWGGGLLQKTFGKQSGYALTAESWELSAHEAGQSVIQNGEAAGQPFGAWIQAHPSAVGKGFCGDKFPVLIKFLDVNTALSVQVHPSDETADAALGEQGKAEVWYVVDAKPGAHIYFGLEREVTQAAFLSQIEAGTVCELLHREEAKPGQLWFITPGTLHSAAGGVLIAEVQQSSDTTLRAYDFGRRDAEGNTRPLHLARVCAVMHTKPTENDAQRQNESLETEDYAFSALFDCGYFRLSRACVYRRMELCCTAESFQALLVICGGGSLLYAGETYALKAGDCFFLPAGLGVYALSGRMECLLTRLS